MSPFKKILAPIDFSDPSRHALHCAADMARRYSAPLTVLHVWDAPYFSVPESFLLYDPSKLPEWTAGLERQLEPIQRELLAANVSQVATQVVHGTPHAEIVRVAEREQFDLIVLGTHGRSGLPHALLGSVAERVVRTAACAVLTIRQPARA